jgi:hypothetical protein
MSDFEHVFRRFFKRPPIVTTTKNADEELDNRIRLEACRRAQQRPGYYLLAHTVRRCVDEANVRNEDC